MTTSNCSSLTDLHLLKATVTTSCIKFSVFLRSNVFYAVQLRLCNNDQWDKKSVVKSLNLHCLKPLPSND
jgi:hypothetical protein